MITSPKSSPSVEEVIPPLVLFECSERIMRGLTPTRPLRPQLSLFHTLGEWFQYMDAETTGSAPPAPTPSGHAPEPALSATATAARALQHAQRPLLGAGYCGRTGGTFTWPQPTPPVPPRVDPSLSPAAAALARQQLLDNARAASITLRHPRLTSTVQIQIKYWGSRFCQARDSVQARELWLSNEQAAVRGLKRGRAPSRLRITVHKLTCLCLWKHDKVLRCYDPFDSIAVKHRCLHAPTHLSVQDGRDARSSGHWASVGLPGTK
jgi:hypothetical protein